MVILPTAQFVTVAAQLVITCVLVAYTVKGVYFSIEPTSGLVGLGSSERGRLLCIEQLS